MKMNSRMAAAAVMAALFVAGAVTGGALMSALQAGPPSFLQGEEGERGDRRWERDGDRGHDSRGREGPREPRVMSERAVRGLAYRLDLSDAQRDTVKAILERQGREAGEVFRQMWPQLQALMDSTNADIRELLTPAQREAFDELLDEDRNLLGRRYAPPRPDSAPPGAEG